MMKHSKEGFMERLVGTFYSWNERGYALICVTPKKRFFMHVSEFDSDEFPKVGQQVSFEVAPPRHPERPRQLPLAVSAKPVVADSVASHVEEIAHDPADFLSGKAVL
jgi:hypothetical protein